MGRGTEFERIQQAAELLLDVLIAISRNVERPIHDIRQMVSYRAGRQFNSVAHNVVLVGQNLQRVLGVQGVQTTLRHGKRVVAEINTTGVLVQFVHGIVHDPTKPKRAVFNQPKVFAHLRANPACQSGGVIGGVAGEKDRVAVGKSSCFPYLFDTVIVEIARNGTFSTAVFKNNIPKTRRAFAPRPII